MSPASNNAGSSTRALFTTGDASEFIPDQRQALRIADDERRRIGQELHDVMGQELVGLVFMSDALMEALRAYPAPEIKLVETLKTTIKRLLGVVRTEAWGLIPIEVEAQELMTALAGLAVQISERFGVDCRFIWEDQITVETNVVATNLYRIAQESITNAIKHGAARHIEVRLCRNDDCVLLGVEDDGIGLREPIPSEAGIGLQIMRFRARQIDATLGFESIDQGGLKVTCAVKEKGQSWKPQRRHEQRQPLS